MCRRPMKWFSSAISASLSGPAIERRVGLLRGVEPQLREAIEVPRAAREVDAALEAIDDRVLPVLAQVGNLGHQRPCWSRQ